MSIPRFAVNRPVTMLMLFCAIMIFGAASLKRLPVELMPNISYKKISIVINIRGGMPPTESETLVVKPIEDAMGTLTNLQSIQSTAEKGRSTIVLRFKPGTNMDFATMEVREKFAKIKNLLPKEIEKPVIAKYEETDLPVMIVAVTAMDPRYTPEVLRKIVDTRIKEVIQRVEGVANVEVGGGREQKILVEFSLTKLRKYNLPILKVINSLGESNLNLMAGNVERGENQVIVRTIGHFSTIEDIKNLPVMDTKTGTIIRLKDIAKVKDSYLEAQTHSRVNKNPVVSMYVQKESTANTIEVCKKVKRVLNDIWPSLDPNIRKVIVSNQADYITDAINTVKDALLRGADIAVLVLIVFLSGHTLARILSVCIMPVILFLPKILLLPSITILLLVLILTNISKTTLIMSISIPASILLTFIFMLIKGVTLNTMTLSGLALALGMLVDNSVVVLENIHSHRAAGLAPKKACISGTQEMVLAIIASTLTTIVVFVPFVFVKEQIKLLYGPFAGVVVFSLIASLLIAITLVPVSASYIKREYTAELGLRIKQFYRRMLAIALRFRYAVLFIPLILGIIAVLCGKHMETEFLGTTEENKFTIFIELPDGAKLDMSDKVVKAVEDMLRKKEKQPDGKEKPLFPEIKNISSWVKGWSSKVYVDIVPRRERTRTTKEVIEAIRPHIADIEKLAVAPTGEKAFIYFSEAKGTGANELFVNVYGHDYDALRKLAYEVAGKMQGIKGLSDVKIRITEGRPELNFVISKKKAALFGLSVKDIADIIHADNRGLRATLFHAKAREIEVIGRLQEKYRRYRKDMPHLVLNTPKGDQIILNQVSSFNPGMGPSEIWHINKRRMIQVSASTGTMPLTTASEKIREVMKGIKLPKNFFWEFGGDYYLMLENRRQLIFCIGLTILLVYMVLASLFESYIQPFIVMITVPMALIGAVFALKTFNKPISMGVLIGGIMLAGIVVNNAIILVDRVNTLRTKGFSLLKALLTTGQSRLRPIMMTTSTTVLALFPMAMDKSEAAGLWAPLAVTVIGGLSVSTLLTLVIVPIIYLLIEDVKGLFS